MGTRRHCKTYITALFLVAICLLAAFRGTPVQAKEEAPSDEAPYDLVLFFGQSNLIGSARMDSPNPFAGMDAEAASAMTGIDPDLIEATVSATKVNLDIPEGAALEYHLLSDSFAPVTGNSRFGEWDVDDRGAYAGVKFQPMTEDFGPVYLDDPNALLEMASSASDSTNLIHAFCAEWYETTGHRVLVVFAAVGGAPIEKFLPVDDPDYLNGVSGSYLFEYIRASVDGAVKRAVREGLPLQNAYFVSFQGEGNARDPKYRRVYQKVVANLKGLGITKGALIETSNKIGDAKLAAGVNRVHQDQEAIIAEDPDICLGSSLDYDHYIPDRKTYEEKDARWRKLWGNLPYEEAYQRARLLTDPNRKNLVHLNSTALAMIGRQTADQLAAFTGLAKGENRQSGEREALQENRF